MVLFLIGVAVGACAAVAVLGFFFVVAEDRETEREKMPAQKRDGWYMNDD